MLREESSARNFTIGGINPLLKSPRADIWSLSVERKLSNSFCRHCRVQWIAFLEIVGNGNSIGNVSYGWISTWCREI